jgi:hypothetical protein
MADFHDREQLKITAAIIRFILEENGCLSESGLDLLDRIAAGKGVRDLRRLMSEAAPIDPAKCDFAGLLGNSAGRALECQLIRTAMEIIQSRSVDDPDELELMKSVAQSTSV